MRGFRSDFCFCLAVYEIADISLISTCTCPCGITRVSRAIWGGFVPGGGSGRNFLLCPSWVSGGFIAPPPVPL